MKNIRALVSVILVGILFASCADMFEQKIPLNGKNSSLDDFFNKDEISKLAQPEQFFVASHYSSTEVRLTWTAVRGAAYYMVERATAAPISESPLIWEEPDDGDYETLNRFVYEVSYIDEILQTATLDAPEYKNKYFYRVTAFNTAKKYEESDPTEPLSAMLFNAPTNLKASGGTSVDYVELRWEHSLGADSYEIFRSDSPLGGSAGSLGTVRGNQNWFQNNVSTVEQGKDFYYMVVARNKFGYETPRTKPAYGYAKVYGAPDAPVVSLAEDAGRGDSKSEIEIKWDASVETTAYYAVYRYSSIDSSLTRLTEKTEDPFWTDTQGLKPGVYYYYKVQAIVDDIKSGSALKSEFSSSDPEGFILSPPDAVVAEKNSDGTVTVKWRPAIGHENERQQYTYNVYADTNLNGSFSTAVESNVVPSTDAEGYISANGLSATNTFFKVATVKNVSSGSVESILSATVSPAPAAAIIVDATQRAYIAGAAANSSGVYPVKITWKKPANESPAFYHVQRSTRTGAGFSRINEVALDASGPWTADYSYDTATGIYTYIDKNETARVGRKYFYRVLSLNQLEQGNFPSDEKIGWGSLTHTQYLLEYNKTMGAALKKLTYMHKPGSTEKLGTETKNGSIGGTIYYNAAISGLGARIIIQVTNYAEFYIENDSANGVYFTLNGNSNTSANMSSNGSMDGEVKCTGMYPGSVWYDNIEIKGGAAGGGTYGVQPEGFPRQQVPYTVLD